MKENKTVEKIAESIVVLGLIVFVLIVLLLMSLLSVGIWNILIIASFGVGSLSFIQCYGVLLINAFIFGIVMGIIGIIKNK